MALLARGYAEGMLCADLEREWHRTPERYRSPTPIAILNWGDNPELDVSLA